MNLIGLLLIKNILENLFSNSNLLSYSKDSYRISFYSKIESDLNYFNMNNIEKITIIS